jgi:hypothetical protein
MTWKGVAMNRRIFFALTAAAFLAGAIILAPAARAEESDSSLTGTPTTNFSLSSTQDRLISYGQEYYGKHNLIITFFPAAFTPV